MPTNWARSGIWIAVAHTLINLVHGAAHEVLEIHLNAVENLIVLAMVLIAPIVAGALLWRGRLGPGFALLAVSMIGALLFAGFKHYIQMSPDHYSQIPSGAWGAIFHASGALLAASEIAGAAIGIAGLRGAGSAARASGLSSK